MDSVLTEIRNIALKYKAVKRVVLFGSRARKDNTEYSDYDIAVFSDDAQQNVLFQNELEEIATLNKIDVVFITKKHIDTLLYENIKKDGIDIMNKFQTKLQNYQNALLRLHESIEESKTNGSLTLRDGVIQRFEFTTELAWKTAREYLLSLEIMDINSPKTVMREAFHNGLIQNETGWLQILQDRNSTSHIYDEEDADAVFTRIKDAHVELFDSLLKILQTKDTIY